MTPDPLQARPAPQPRPSDKCTVAAIEKNRTALPHALPFGPFFEEIAARRSKDLADTICRLFNIPPKQQRVWLDAQIAASTHAYTALLTSKERESYGDPEEKSCEAADANLLKLLHAMQTSSLCLSGGGIRSASFCLGALQGLSRFGFEGEGACDWDAEILPEPETEECAPPDPATTAKKDKAPRHLLCELDHLSTVSGGGYIACWLMAWVKRLTDQKQGIESAGEPIAGARRQQCGARAFRDALNALAGLAPHTTGDPAPRAIRHLRDYTSFLAPKFGMTLDTWTLAAIIFRNMFINWLMILPLFLCAIAFIQVLHFSAFRYAGLLVRDNGFRPAFYFATFLFIFAGIMAGVRMPSRQAEKLFAAKLEPKAVFGLFVFPLAVSSVLLSAIWLERPWLWQHHPKILIAWFTAAGWLSFSTVSIVRTTYTEKLNPEYSRPRRYVSGILAAGVAALLLALALFGIGTEARTLLQRPSAVATAKPSSATLMKLPDNSTVDLRVTPPEPPPNLVPQDARDIARPEVDYRLTGVDADYFMLFGFSLVWALLMGASSLFSAFLSDYEDDIDREWWARVGGMMMYTQAIWSVALAIVIYAPYIFTPTITIGKFSFAGLITGLLGALGGFSTSSGAGSENSKKSDLGFLGGFLTRFSLIVPALCCAALLLLALLIAYLEQYLANYIGGYRSLGGHVWVFLGALVISLLANSTINVNIFSLHGMYRMRLMRAFLGASNTRRRPDKFTGFDDRDVVWEDEVPCEPGVPLHLIHATVNLVGTRDLAWAQRKAEGFTISPLHCGGWRLGYVPTGCYGGPRGISLATAMAISGAAFNPNMGYHSSPLVTIIMALFNVRLGWWLPNPKYKRKEWRATLAKKLGLPTTTHTLMAQKSPRLALRPLLNEMFGGTDDTTPYIELTDGGHFDNLGLYEMVLRRCHKIIVVDSGADPNAEFEDLGNAIRKIEIDLGIPIEFRGNLLNMNKGSLPANMRCAVADIRYKCVDGDSCPEPGILIYIKSIMNGQEPPDVRQYAITHPTFPHETTVNQFFNENQFESYRHLGSFTIDQIVSAPLLTPAGGVPKARPVANMQAFFDLAVNYVSSAAPKGKTSDAPDAK